MEWPKTIYFSGFRHVFFGKNTIAINKVKYYLKYNAAFDVKEPFTQWSRKIKAMLFNFRMRHGI